MEPRIQYATTADGVSIAYWAIGEGMALVNPPPALPWSHIELEWQIPGWRHWYEHLAETYRVVRYDSRGAGLSAHNITEYSLDTHLKDLEAVVDRLDLETFALFGFSYNGPIAIAYAAKHPDRVSHLILWCALASQKEAKLPPQRTETLERMMDSDYELFSETLAHTVFGWSEGEAAHQFAQYMQASLTPERAKEYWANDRDIDASGLLASVKAPTLVIHRRDLPLYDIEIAKSLCARIPNARLKVVEGSSLSPYIGDMQAAVDAMTEFTGKGQSSAPKRHAHPGAAGPNAGGAFRTIMFTDMEGSTALTQRLGDAKAQDLVRLHNEIVRIALADHGGTQVKHTGDGIMAWFSTASAAVECGIDIQRAFEQHNESSPDEQVMVRLGINAGEPVIEGDDLFGTAVQLAARVCARATPGEILTSDVVRQLVAGKGFLFADRGTADLRGFEDPVRLYEVRWREDAE